MSMLAVIAPKRKKRVIDLVGEAGVDVREWADTAGGEDRAAANPKYCYEWAFVEPGVVVVLNLWLDRMKEVDGTILQEINFRETAAIVKRIPNKAVWVKRALAADNAIQLAVRESLPLRVIINAGDRRKEGSPEKSRVQKRELDQVEWHVGTYDFVSGRACLVRGPASEQFVDQYSIPDPHPPVPRRTVLRETFIRDSEVRARARSRARGRCELCGQPGFEMPNGAKYLETHHIVSLADGGPDTIDNVIVLCPNHHREAHFGLNPRGMQDILRASVQKRNRG